MAMKAPGVPGVHTSLASPSESRDPCRDKTGDVPLADMRAKPETCWKSIIACREHTGAEMTPRTGTCDIGIATWRRRHANAEGVRDRHHTCEEPCEGTLSRPVLQQRRGGSDPLVYGNRTRHTAAAPLSSMAFSRTLRVRENVAAQP
jgi:hypothetical protein